MMKSHLKNEIDNQEDFETPETPDDETINIQQTGFVVENYQGFIPSRAVTRIIIGGIYVFKNTQNLYQLIEIIKYNQGLFKNLDTQVSEVMNLSDFTNLKDATNNNVAYDISEISDAQWQRIQMKYAAIKPLIDGSIKTSNIDEYVKKCGVPRRTLLRWKSQYAKTNTLISLLDNMGGWKRGDSRLSSQVEALIQDVIQNYYLTNSNVSIKSVINKIYQLCHEYGFPKPSPNTIRLRIERIPDKQILKKHGKAALARKKYMPTAGTFPNADYPLRVVQIDHTPADVILVDDIYRKPIGRPFITVAIDVYSRMIIGYYISLDAPSVTSVAMCIARAILPKDNLLYEFDIQAKWDCSGIMHTIHVDNGSDFKSEDLKKSCALYGINLEFRPVARPHYGGHIERLIGTLMNQTHELDGTTFSNIKERDEYQSEKKAVLTLAEYEKWLLNYIVRIYHNQVHSQLGRTPNEQYRIGIYGDEYTAGSGLPKIPSDPLTLIIDFLPSFQRTVQNKGITIDGLNYYDHCLNTFINSVDDDGNKRQFTVRRDPRNISYIWFFDPVLRQYFKVPLANQTLPVMSLWEYNSLRNYIKATSGAVNETLIYQAWEDMRLIEQQAKNSTLKSRRAEQRRKHHEKSQDIYDKAATLSENGRDMPLSFPPDVMADIQSNSTEQKISLPPQHKQPINTVATDMVQNINPMSDDDYFTDIE